MESIYPYLLLIIGVLAGYAFGAFTIKKQKSKVEEKITELELNMLEDKTEISRLKKLVGKLLEMESNNSSNRSFLFQRDTF